MMLKKSSMARTVTIVVAVLLLSVQMPALAEENPYILLLPLSSEVEYDVDSDHYSKKYSTDGYMILLYEAGEEVAFQVITDNPYVLEDAATEEVFEDYSVSEEGMVSFYMPGKDLYFILGEEDGQEGSGEEVPAETQEAPEEPSEEAQEASEEPSESKQEIDQGDETMVTVGASVIPASPDETVRRGGNYTFQVELQEGYSRTDEFAVKANGEVLPENEDGSYTISNISDDQIITVEGVADITAPEIEIFLNGESAPIQAGEDRYSFLDPVAVSMEASDAGSGLAVLQYALSSEPLTKPSKVTGWNDYSEEITVANPGEQILYTKAVDAAGNETDQATAIFIGRVQEAPAVFGSAETIAGKADGHISGLDTTMEYSTDGKTYTKVTDPSMTFAAGTYAVRYAAEDEYSIPKAVKVKVGKGRELSVVFIANNEIVDVIDVDYGGSIPESEIPEVPPKEGYEWMDAVWDADSFENITEDEIIQAEYQEVEFTISFSTNLTDSESSAAEASEQTGAEEEEQETDVKEEAEEKDSEKETAEKEDKENKENKEGYEFSVILFGDITARVQMADGTVENADQENALTVTDLVEEVVISSAVNPEILFSLDGVELTEEDGTYSMSTDADGNIILTFDEEAAAGGAYVLIISE